MESFDGIPVLISLGLSARLPACFVAAFALRLTCFDGRFFIFGSHPVLGLKRYRSNGMYLPNNRHSALETLRPRTLTAAMCDVEETEILQHQ